MRRRLPGRPALWAALAYIVVALAVLGPSIRPGHTVVPADALTLYSPFREAAGGFRADNPIVSDAATQFFPWMRFVGDHLRHGGGVPAWNPLIAGGVRVSPNGYVNVWYPPFQVLRVLDPFDAYNVLLLVHLVVGALGIYALARTLGARPLPSFVAGLLAFAAGGWLHWSLHLVHLIAMVWLAWAMAATVRAVERPSPRSAAALGAVLGLWWLGANPQYAWFGGFAWAAWTVGVIAWPRPAAARTAGGRRGATVGAVLGGVALGALLGAPAILATAHGASEILRAHEPAEAMTETHLPLRHGIRLLVPDAVGNPADGFLYASGEEFAMDSPFVGVITVVLAGVAIAGLRARRDRNAMLLAIGTAVVLAFAFLGPPHLALRLLPGYDRFRGSARWVSILPPFALPLAALGLDALATGERNARRAAAWTAGGLVAITALWLGREALVASAPHGYLARRALLAAALAVAVAVAARRPRAVVAVALACAVVEVGFAAPRWFPDVTERSAFPRVGVIDAAASRGGRIVRVGGPRDLPAYLPPDVPMAYGVADTSALTPLFPRDTDRYLRVVDDYGPTARDLNVAPPLLSIFQAASPLLDALDVRTIVLPDGGAEPRLSPGPAVVVRDARPASPDAMWRAIAGAGWDAAATSAVADLPRPVSGSGGQVRAAGGDGAGFEAFDVTAPTGGFLRVAGRYDEGWHATVDGRAVRVYRADGLLRGVVVPAGRHRVEFRFRDRETERGLLLAAAGVVLTALSAARGQRRRRPRA